MPQTILRVREYPPLPRLRRINVGQIQVNYADPLGALLVSCWLPWQMAMRDVKRDTADQLDGVYQNTGQVKVFGGALGLSAKFSRATGGGGGSGGNSTAGYAIVPTDNKYNQNSEGTMACWFYLDSLVSGENPVLMSQARTAVGITDNDGVVLYVQNDSGQARINGLIRWHGTSTDVVGATGAVRTNRWHHGALTWRSGGDSEIHLDGVRQAVAGSTVSGLDLTGLGVLLGSHIKVNPPGTDNFWYTLDGRLGRCDRYRRALKPDEVHRLAIDPMAALRGGSGYYPVYSVPSGTMAARADYTDALTWTSDHQPGSTGNSSNQWNDAFIVISPTPTPTVTASFGDTLTWAGGDETTVGWGGTGFKREPFVQNTLSWSDAATSFTPAESNAQEPPDTVIWSDKFFPVTDDLASRRYRR